MAVPAVGYVGAAVIAASAAWVGLILGKEQKTTEFRQDWINAQRSDLAKIVSIASNVGPADTRTTSMREFDEAFARVRLRENPDKHEWAQVLKAVERLRKSAFEQPSAEDVRIAGNAVVELSQRLLKTEWMRVRGGEPWFVALKWILPPAIALVGWGLAYGQGFIVIH